MFEGMRRREFLIQSSRLALGSSLLPLAGCVAGKTQAVSVEPRQTTLLGTLIADLEDQIPKWMDESKVP